ncbi:MAG TPA: hypothetical protein VEA38_00850 [Terriglobales bacterium]|nr:hypothetical protein [Terriglobales bacterium]
MNRVRRNHTAHLRRDPDALPAPRPHDGAERTSLSVTAHCIDCRRGLDRRLLDEPSTILPLDDYCGPCGRPRSAGAKEKAERFARTRFADLFAPCEIRL